MMMTIRTLRINLTIYFAMRYRFVFSFSGRVLYFYVYSGLCVYVCCCDVCGCVLFCVDG